MLHGFSSVSALSTILMFCRLYISFICSVNTSANSFAIFLALSGLSFFTLISKNCVLSICFASTFCSSFDTGMSKFKFCIVFCNILLLLAILLYVEISPLFRFTSVCVKLLSVLFSSATNSIVTDDLYSGFL